MNARFHARRRRGALTVEFALVAPLAFLVFFASFEFSRMNMVRHTIDIAAYEGARRGIVPGATAADVTDRVNQVLAQVSVADSQVTVTPGAIDNRTRQVTVDVQTPMDSNGFVAASFFNNLTVQSQSTLAREGFTN